MDFVLASCCANPWLLPQPHDITPWMILAFCCGLLLLGEAGVLVWRLRRWGAPKPWRRPRVLIPAVLGMLALGAGSLEWHAMRVLITMQPNAWFDQANATIVSATFYSWLIALVTLWALAVGAVAAIIE